MIEEQQNFSDETIRRFLLGDLNSAEQSNFERSLFMDSDLEERVRLAELELSDDYASAGLSDGEREVIRQQFLLTSGRKRQFQVSQALQNSFAIKSALATPRTISQRMLGLFDLRQHAWKYAFATLILIILLTTAVLVTRNPSRIAIWGTPNRVAPRPSATAPPRITNHTTNAPAPAHNEQSSPLPLHGGELNSLDLNSSTPLDTSPVIGSTNDVVQLQLKLDDPPSEFYDLNLMTAAGESVFTAKAIKRAETNLLIVDVPGSALTAGDFQILLIRAGIDSKESAGTYYFRVR
jgi:hypothetical protein